jgi:CDP-paratose synthetase
MKILITGATGYLGSKLLDALIDTDDGHSITIAKRSFSNLYRIEHLLSKIRVFNLDQMSMLELFKAGDFDLILHCATDYGRQDLPRSELIEANLLLPLRLLEMGSKLGVKYFINTDTMLDKRVSAYSLSKKQFREWLLHFSGAINATTILLEHFYGPGDNESKFVTYIVKSLLNDIPAIPLTPGDQLRDFMYMDDVVSAFMSILKNLNAKNNGYTEYEVGSGRLISIKEFVTLAKEISGNKKTLLDFGAIPYRENETMSVKVNMHPLKRLGWISNVELEEGLRKTFDAERISIQNY